jgi:hypothetical protein
MRPIEEWRSALRFPQAGSEYTVNIRLQLGEERQGKNWLYGTSGRLCAPIFQYTRISSCQPAKKRQSNSRHGPVDRDTSESIDLRKMVHRKEMEVPSAGLY